MSLRTRTSRRSSGLARRIALGGGALALAGLAAPAAGQGELFAPYPPLKWVAQESLDSHQDAHDEGVDIVYWKEETGSLTASSTGSSTNHWIYVTGWVTEMDGSSVKGTRFATFKYDAAFFDAQTGNPPTPTAQAYFPPLGTAISAGDTYKAVAMTVDPISGDIYVTGEGPGAAGQDYFVVKYNKELAPQWAGEARSYNGPAGGDDIPADIALDGCGQEVIVVTGTSPGINTGLDIATVAWYTGNGTRVSDLWPGDGVRRYNNELEDGDDRAAKVDEVCIVVEDSEAILSATVLGTSWGGTTKEDDYTLHRWKGTDTTPSWEFRYDNGGNDVAVDFVQDGLVYITGHSEDATTSDIDIATIGYIAGEPTYEWLRRWDYMGEPDYPLDLHVTRAAHSPTFGYRFNIWITGAGFDGTYTDAVTIMYGDGWGGLSLDFEDAWGVSNAFEYGRAITTFQREPYFAGCQGASTFDRMLALSYFEDPPDYLLNWYRTISGPSLGGTDNEGRGIVAAVVESGTPVQRSIYVVGVSTESGEGRQFTTWRYQE